MKENSENPTERYLGNIAEEITTISGTCTEIKESQLNCATTNDLTTLGNTISTKVVEKVDDLMTRGIIPAFSSVQKAIENIGNQEVKFDKEALTDGLSEGTAKIINAHIDQKISKGVSDAFADTTKYMKSTLGDLNHRVERLLEGNWWFRMAQWAKITAIVIILADIGFAWAFFHQLSENSKFRKVEWLFRYERVCYDPDGIKAMMLREEAMMVGTKAEQDSLKAKTVRLERAKRTDRTHVYFRPSDSWTPESPGLW